MAARRRHGERSKEVAPDTGAAVGRVCAMLSMGDFAKDLEREASLDGESVGGLPRFQYVHTWFRRFVS